MEVSFKYLKNGADSLQTYSSSIHGQMLSKLALLEIAVKGRKGSDSLSIPAYKFSYRDNKDLPSGGYLSWHDVNNSSPNTLYHFQDDFGFLDIPSGSQHNPNESQGVAWSLQKIVYPEGGSHEIVYESDSLTSLSLSYAEYNNASQACSSNVIKQFAKIRQGGPRVKTIKIYAMGQGSGSSPADSITFKYHNGRRSAIADVKFYKLLNYGTSGSPLYFAGDRGQANIAYEWVEKKLMDQSCIRTFYRTTDGPEPQFLYFGGDANQKVIYSGNTRWSWGDITRVEYYSATSGLIKDETYHWFYRGHNADPSPIQLAKVAPQGSGPNCASAVYLNFTYKRLDSLVTRHYFGTKTVTSREAYEYNDDGTFLKSKTETSGHGKKRKTEYPYAHEVSTSPPYSVMEDRNMRSQMAQTTIGTGFIDEAYSSSATTWKAVASKYLPEKEFRLRDRTPSENALFINWSNPDTSLWIRTQTFSGYDAHGNPTRIHDAYGSETTISWDVASATLIDSIKTRPNSTLKPLTTKYTYDPNTFRLTAITDPNNQKTEYKYDPLQRLIEMMTPDKRTVARHSYLYSRQAPGSNDNFVTTNPNFVRTVVSTHAEHVRNHDFENGSGSAPTSWIVTGAGSGVGSWDNTTAYSGARSLKADMPTPSGISYVLWKATFNEKMSPKVAYRMELWAKTANGYNGNAKFILYFNAESKTITIPAGDRDWTKYTLDFIPLATTDYLYEVRLDFTSGGTYKGAIWYDRANFYKLNTAKTFADGLGRDIEVMSFEGNNRSIQTATYYDFANRLFKVTKPFFSADTSFTLTTNSGGTAVAIDSARIWYGANHKVYNDPVEYDISATHPYPFSETEYYPDPLNRVKNQYFPGAAFSKLGPDKKYVKNFYTTNAADELGFAANKVLETRTLDENGILTEIFTDTFGNKVGVRVDSAAAAADSTKLATLFQYDILNNLTKIVPPKAFQSNGNTPSLSNPLCTIMTYNTLGQLTSRKTPDAGTDSSYYDKKGNLRLFKDAKGEAANPKYFIYHKYDNLNRKIEEGTMPVGSPTKFNQNKADSAAFPIGGHTMKVKFQYDSTTYAANGTQRNLRGRLDAIEYVDDRFPLQKGYIFYSYDNNGNVEWIDQYIFTGSSGYLSAKTDYQYDALGKITKIHFRRHFPPGASTDAFYVWYDYDALGRLERVFTNTTDVKPLTPINAQYSYWPSGQVKRLVLGNTMQGVDYLYNSRDWLTQINSHYLLAGKDPGNDSTTVMKDRFGEIIGYNKKKYIADDGDYSGDFAAQFNGNISWATLNTKDNTNPVGASLTGWMFKYDKANRLIKGNWGFNSNVLGTNWDPDNQTNPNKYDLTGITYDRNGNLTAMTRRSQTGAATSMTYNYTANTNKLHQVAGLNGQLANNYTYDPNGNMNRDKAKLGSTAADTVAYDYRNLPTKVQKSLTPNNGTISFGYDGKGQRVSKNNLFYVPGADGRVIAVYDDKGTLLYWNIWGLDLLGQRFWKQ